MYIYVFTENMHRFTRIVAVTFCAACYRTTRLRRRTILNASVSSASAASTTLRQASSTGRQAASCPCSDVTESRRRLDGRRLSTALYVISASDFNESPDNNMIRPIRELAVYC